MSQIMIFDEQISEGLCIKVTLVAITNSPNLSLGVAIFVLSSTAQGKMVDTVLESSNQGAPHRSDSKVRMVKKMQCKTEGAVRTSASRPSQRAPT